MSLKQAVNEEDTPLSPAAAADYGFDPKVYELRGVSPPSRMQLEALWRAYAKVFELQTVTQVHQRLIDGTLKDFLVQMDPQLSFVQFIV